MDDIFFTFPFDFDFDRLCFFQIYSFYRVTKCLIFLCEGLPITLSLISFCSVEIPMTCSLVCFAHVAKLSKMFSDNIPKLSLLIYIARNWCAFKCEPKFTFVSPVIISVTTQTVKAEHKSIWCHPSKLNLLTEKLKKHTSCI